MSNSQNDIVADNLRDWLDEMTVTLNDVMLDEKGYYVMSEYDTGHPSDVGYDAGLKKVYLPPNFQELNINGL